MTQRRAHWTDDLIEGVRSKIGMHQHGPIGEIRIYNPFDDEVYNVIAEVEDWLLAQPIFDLFVSGRAVRAEAAIQRVRDTCRATNSVRMSIDDSWLPGWDLAVEYVLRSLDGAS